MEQWEIDLRSKLDKEVEPGMYEIGSGKVKGYTGKGGYINYLVALHKSMKGWAAELKEELDSKSEDETIVIPEYDSITYEKLRKIVEDIMYSKD